MKISSIWTSLPFYAARQINGSVVVITGDLFSGSMPSPEPGEGLLGSSLFLVILIHD